MVTAFETQALATPNLDALWMLTGTGADTGPNNLPVTLSGAFTAGVECIKGAGPGMLSSSSLYASRAVAGTPLASTGARTIIAWFSPTSVAVSSPLAGRNNHLQLRSTAGGNSTGGVGLLSWPGGTSTDVRSQPGLAPGSICMGVAVFTTLIHRVYANPGPIVQRAPIPGTLPAALPAVTDPFYIGSVAGSFAGTIQGVGVWSRALNTGELRKLFRAGWPL